MTEQQSVIQALFKSKQIHELSNMNFQKRFLEIVMARARARPCACVRNIMEMSNVLLYNQSHMIQSTEYGTFMSNMTLDIVISEVYPNFDPVFISFLNCLSRGQHEIVNSKATSSHR